MTYVFLAFCVFFLIAALRTFVRTGLKGELLRICGVVIFLFSYAISNIILGIVGFIIFNIGWIILVTIEHDKRKEIYRQTTFFYRLIGNVPLLREERIFPVAYKPIIGIITGICCILIAIVAIVCRHFLHCIFSF
jgi:hypothetical protein